MSDWKTLISEGIDDIRDLQDILHLADGEVASLLEVQDRFPLFINSYYLSLINPDDPDDPIRRMSIPSTCELDGIGSFDTSGEQSNTKMTGLQHKYPETALVISSNQCAMYCRHCFRRRMVGVTKDEVSTHLDEMFDYIRRHEEISNVLVSGGDAFMNSNAVIRGYLEALTGIPHIDLIRFGTRMPVVIPQRFTEDPELIELLGEYAQKKQIYVITQFNHPREITPESTEAVRKLLKIGIPVRNQAVLLRGVNDNPVVLGTLLKRLTAIGALPYYVFQCRPVLGVANRFQVPLREGYSIVEQAKNMQNGQGKCFRYIASHPTGKIEILGNVSEDEMLFKYHQAKDPSDRSRIFTQKIADGQCWL